MACGGCGKRRKRIEVKVNRTSKTIAFPKNMVQNSKLKSVANTAMPTKKMCDICQSSMRSLHTYNKTIKKITKTWFCSNVSCQNSKGS